MFQFSWSVIFKSTTVSTLSSFLPQSSMQTTLVWLLTKLLGREEWLTTCKTISVSIFSPIPRNLKSILTRLEAAVFPARSDVTAWAYVVALWTSREKEFTEHAQNLENRVLPLRLWSQSLMKDSPRMRGSVVKPWESMTFPSTVWPPHSELIQPLLDGTSSATRVKKLAHGSKRWRHAWRRNSVMTSPLQILSEIRNLSLTTTWIVTVSTSLHWYTD